MQEEMKWIEEVRSGNKQAYAKIINKYKNQLYSTVLRMTKNPQDAQDLVQEAFIKVYHQLDKYDQKGSFSSWLYRVTINHCLDEFRKKRYSFEHVELREESRIENDHHPEIVFLKKEKSRQLERLIATLPEDERMIILLKYANERSYEEISELLGLPLSTVRNKLHRAKKKMRQLVKEEGGYFNEMYAGR